MTEALTHFNGFDPLAPNSFEVVSVVSLIALPHPEINDAVGELMKVRPPESGKAIQRRFADRIASP